MGWFDWLFGPPGEAKFAQLFIAELRKAGETRPIRFDEEEFQLVIADDEEQSGIINLRNFYTEFSSLPPADRKRYLPDMIQAILAPRDELPEDFEEVKLHLRPKIWARAGIEHTNLQSQLRGGKQGIDMPQYEVGSHLIASIVYDLPRSVRSISSEELEQWGTTYYEALEIATQNLTETKCGYSRVGNLYILATGDSYDASRILLTDIIRSFEVEGDVIAMVPNRDMLLVAGSDDDDGLEGMIELAEKGVEGTRPLASTPLRLEGDDWVDWMPSRGHQLFDRFRILELKFLYQEYAQQKEMLDKLYEQQHLPRFVASYSAASDKNGENLFSYSVWGEGVETLLPETERVMFFRPQKDKDPEIVAAAPWHRVQKIVGHLMSEVDLYPKRYLITEFPSEKELGLLGKERLE